MALCLGVAEATDGEAMVPTIDAPAWFTSEQAERGEAKYQSECAECHGDEIVDVIATWPRAGFFYNFISSQMPIDNPGGLSPQDYTDILAFLLAANGFPAGDEELPPDREIIDTIEIRDLLPE